MKIDLLETPSEDVRIEVLPLIDIIFCILTFFILAAVGLTRQQAINLDLPSATTGAPLPSQGIGSAEIERQRLYVSIDAIGQVYLDQQPVTLDLLYDVLLQHQQVSPEGLIVLYASRDARYEDFIRVLDLLRAVGGDRVALATLPNSVDGATPFPQQDDPLNPTPSSDEGGLINPTQPPGTLEPFPLQPQEPPSQNEPLPLP